MHKPKNIKELKMFCMEDWTKLQAFPTLLDNTGIDSVVLLYPGQSFKNINCKDADNFESSVLQKKMSLHIFWEEVARDENVQLIY